MRLNAKLVVFGASALALVAGGGQALAKKSDKAPPPAPQAYQQLIECKQIADPTARLACYDQQVGAIESATAAGDLVISDRQTIKEARRGLFGFRLPSLGIFGGGGDDENDANDIKAIDSTVKAARQFGYGSWRVTLDDGSVWEQVDDQKLLFDPVSGNKVHIYKGAVGTFRMNIDGQRAIKVRRVE